MGESGGPLIDLDTGQALAIVKGAQTGAYNASFDATPVTFAKSFISAYVSANKDNKSGENSQKITSQQTEIDNLRKENAKVVSTQAETQKALDFAKEQVVSLSSKNAVLIAQIAESSKQVNAERIKEKVAVDENARISQQLADIKKDVEAANNQNLMLSQQSVELKRKGDDAAVDAEKRESLTNDQIALLSHDKVELSDKLTRTEAKLKDSLDSQDKLTKQATNLQKAVDENQSDLTSAIRDKNNAVAQLQSMIVQLNQANKQLTDTQATEGARAQAEDLCNEKSASRYDADLPANAKQPRTLRQADAQSIIDNCAAALRSQDKGIWRRINAQLARGYLLQGNTERSRNEVTATSSYNTALALLEESSAAGSAFASNLLGWIYHGGLNVEGRTIKCTFRDTPDDKKAFGYYKRAADGGHPYGALAMATYSLWPQCYQLNTTAPVPLGLEYLEKAKNRGIAEVTFLEEYLVYYGVKVGEKNLEMLKKLANEVGSDPVVNFARNVPSRQPMCPPDFLR
jgi:hypothetical protein